MRRLSVNINKIATLRNTRPGDRPDVLRVASDIVRWGVKGITIHPRPDERHIRYADAESLQRILAAELNIEGNPTHPPFCVLVDRVRPTQLTLVPDAEDARTSDAGWDCIAHGAYLTEIIARFRQQGMRVSIFIDPVEAQVRAAHQCGADAVELYTKPYADNFPVDPHRAVVPYVQAAQCAKVFGLRVHAGHDLNLENSPFLKASIPFLDEVSIGHALICDALYMGLEKAIAAYRAIWD